MLASKQSVLIGLFYCVTLCHLLLGVLFGQCPFQTTKLVYSIFENRLR